MRWGVAGGYCQHFTTGSLLRIQRTLKLILSKVWSKEFDNMSGNWFVHFKSSWGYGASIPMVLTLTWILRFCICYRPCMQQVKTFFVIVSLERKYAYTLGGVRLITAGLWCRPDAGLWCLISKCTCREIILQIIINKFFWVKIAVG